MQMQQNGGYVCDIMDENEIRRQIQELQDREYLNCEVKNK